MFTNLLLLLMRNSNKILLFILQLCISLIDDDLIIIKEIKPPETRKNSLENEFQKSLSYSHEWLKEM